MDASVRDADALGLSENSASERAGALRAVIRRTSTRLDEDEALWMLGLHYRPEPPKARRHPMYSGKVIPAEVVSDDQ